MKTRVLVIGGYGNFGTFISRRLSRETDIALIIAGRSLERARTLASELGAEAAALDIAKDLHASFQALRPDIVVHTSGPFQEQDYGVASASIAAKCHYVDLADGRAFVANIASLDAAAKAAEVLVVSGASSVPALTSAIIDEYTPEFASLEVVDYGIATAQRTNRGLATTRAVLGYVGVPFRTLMDSALRTIYGWQGLHWRKFAGLGWRALGNCDIPDLALFPERYPGLKTIRFGAGLEVTPIHMSLWALSWLVRCRLLPNLGRAAPFFLATARTFDRLGSDASGFFMDMTGNDHTGKYKRVTFDLIARSGDGPMIPCIPAIVTTLAIARGKIKSRGATPCVGLVDLDALLREFRPLSIEWQVRR